MQHHSFGIFSDMLKNICPPRSVNSNRIIGAVFLLICNYSFSAPADETNDEFAITLSACIGAKKLTVPDELKANIISMFGNADSRAKLGEIGKFLDQIPASQRPDAYDVYQKCIPDVLNLLRPLSTPTPTPTAVAVTTYKICTGEYEKQCQPHDVYLYCYADLKTWASAKCNSFTSSRYNTYGGNKCGYAMDLVTCAGPR